MGGICGIIHTHRDHPVDQDLLHSISDTMVHRGPGGKRSYLGPGIGLEMRWLPINAPLCEPPLTNGKDSPIWVVLDGELYNRVELKAELEIKGHTFQSGSDAELITHLYQDRGERFPEFLVGEFAIGLWDSSQRRLILVRDHIGVRPLYIASLKDALIFASELRALLKHPDIAREIDWLAFSEFLTFQHTLAPRTILANIQKLPAGHIAIYRENKLTTSAYWDLQFPEEASKDLNEKRHVQQFREAFKTAIKRRLGSGTPAGAFLSGGMDSSSIVAMMSRLNTQELHTYSGGYRDSHDQGELSRAKIVADHFQTHHHELAFSHQDYLEVLPRFIAYMDDPVADAASPIRMLLAGVAKEEVPFILGGEGGDDVTGGYGLDQIQKRADRLRRFQRLSKWLRCTLPALMSPFLPSKLRAWLNRGNRDISTINAEEHFAMMWEFEAEEKRCFFPVLREIDKTCHCHERTREIYAHSHTDDPLSQALYFLTKTWVPENLMMSADKMLMSHGVEFRAPFLDRDLVEVSAQIPSRYKIPHRANNTYVTKNILRQAMQDMLPDATLRFPKSPFYVPTTEWFQSALNHYCQDVLLSDTARSADYYDVKQVQNLLTRHLQNPTQKSSLQIKLLLFFEMWRQLILVA